MGAVPFRLDWCDLMAILFPGHEKQPVAVRVFEANKSATPPFVTRFAEGYRLLFQVLIKIVHIGNAQEKVNAAPSLEHSFDLLNQRNAQRTGSNRGYRRVGDAIIRIDLKAEHLSVEGEGFLEIIDFKKQLIETGNHSRWAFRRTSRLHKCSKRHQRQSPRTEFPEPCE